MVFQNNNYSPEFNNSIGFINQIDMLMKTALQATMMNDLNTWLKCYLEIYSYTVHLWKKKKDQDRPQEILKKLNEIRDLIYSSDLTTEFEKTMDMSQAESLRFNLQSEIIKELNDADLLMRMNRELIGIEKIKKNLGIE